MKDKDAAPSQPRRRKRRKGDTARLAALLAPLEEQNKPAAEHQLGSPLNSATAESDRNFGAIIVDNDDLKVPADLAGGQDDKHFLGIEPVVLVVLIVMLGFIAFIAWQISLMPAR